MSLLKKKMGCILLQKYQEKFLKGNNKFAFLIKLGTLFKEMNVENGCSDKNYLTTIILG